MEIKHFATQFLATCILFCSLSYTNAPSRQTSDLMKITKKTTDTNSTTTGSKADVATTITVPTATKILATFHTNQDDKDWDSQIGTQIYFNGHVVAEKFCCSGDRNDDHWDDHTDNPAKGPIVLDIKEPITKEQLDNALYDVSLQAVGGDHWYFDARLHIEFSDGTHRDWTFLTNDLESTRSDRVTKRFNL